MWYSACENGQQKKMNVSGKKGHHKKCTQRSANQILHIAYVEQRKSTTTICQKSSGHGITNHNVYTNLANIHFGAFFSSPVITLEHIIIKLICFDNCQYRNYLFSWWIFFAALTNWREFDMMMYDFGEDLMHFH